MPDLPGKDGGALALVVGDLVDDARRGHARLRAANRARLDRSRLIVPAHLSMVRVRQVYGAAL